MACLADGTQTLPVAGAIPGHKMVDYKDLQDLQRQASQGIAQPVCFVPAVGNDSIDLLTQAPGDPPTAIQVHTNTNHDALSGEVIYDSLEVRTLLLVMQCADGELCVLVSEAHSPASTDLCVAVPASGLSFACAPAKHVGEIMLARHGQALMGLWILSQRYGFGVANRICSTGPL